MKTEMRILTTENEILHVKLETDKNLEMKTENEILHVKLETDKKS